MAAPAGRAPSRAGQAHACGCGHPRAAHEHYKGGTDCALCPCARFRRPGRARVTAVACWRLVVAVGLAWVAYLTFGLPGGGLWLLVMPPHP